jgi:hypothetical protein
VSKPPDFDELLEGLDGDEDRARLKRVHELLVEAGPPPQLSPTLETPPPASPRDLPWQRPRRMNPRTVLVAAALITVFFVGYLTGSTGSPQQGPTSGIRIARTVQLEGEGDTKGAIGVGVRDEKGNLPMVLSVWGLDHLAGGDYYTLALLKDGKPRVTCGTFNVSGDQTTIPMVAAYNIKRFDGWVVLHYDAKTHDDTPVLRSSSI